MREPRRFAPLAAAFFVSALGAIAQGQGSVTLSWDPSPSSGIAGYRLYVGGVSRTYTNVVAVGNETTKTVSGLIPGRTYFFAVTAYDTLGRESDFSSEIICTIPLPPITPPSITLASPANGTSYAAPASISLAATVAANGHTITRVLLYGRDDNGWKLLAACTSAPYTFTWTPVSTGSYNLMALAWYDSGGSVYSTSADVTVTNVPLPSVVLASPAHGTVYTPGATIPLAASVTANGYSITQVQFYNGATLLGIDTSAPYSLSWNNVSAGSYSLSARVVYGSGSTVSSATANVTVAAAQPPSGPTFPADSGTISLPFVAAGGGISQPAETSNANGGRAVYTFNLANAGSYLVSALVSAPNEGQNSFYVNIDAEPTNPLMIWDVPVCTSPTRHTVSWRGNGNGDPASSQYAPKVFALSAGTHQLIIRGREANTTLGTISIVAVPPELRIQTVPGGSVTLGAAGQPGQTYRILCSEDLKDWAVIGVMTLDTSGSFTFTDPAGNTRLNRFYRLQGP